MKNMFDIKTGVTLTSLFLASFINATVANSAEGRLTPQNLRREPQCTRHEFVHLNSLLYANEKSMDLDGIEVFACNFQSDAIEHCAAQGMHLPSARELAQVLMRSGAKGISEITDGKPDDSYYLISTTNLDGTQDYFYFSPKGYTRPKGDFGEKSFWSSSSYSNSTYYVYFLNGPYGAMGSGPHVGLHMAAYCLPGR